MYPVRYEADYVEPRSRAKTFFRLILAIPWSIVAQIYGIGAFVVAFLAWFAILFTGRYPEGLYNFQAGFLRFLGRFNGWVSLQTDEWPPFGFDRDPQYPIRVDVDPPLEKYNRWKTAFRVIVGFPVMFMLMLFGYIFLPAVIAWFHIVFVGRNSGGIHNAITVAQAYYLRSTAYFLLVTETLPPISDQAPAPNLKPGRAAAKTTATRKPAAKKS